MNLYFIWFVKIILGILGVLISVAFITLFERKILGASQIRKGPDKVGIYGLLQPIADAIKLFPKGTSLISMASPFGFFICPPLSLGLALVVWLTIPVEGGLLSLKISFVFLLCCLGAGVYPILFAGWSANSKYSLMGSLRAIAQTISYEVSLAMILLFFIALLLNLSFKGAKEFQLFSFLLILSPPLSLVWLASSLAECNRTPFDFAEGESELVSGFNTEFSGGGFAILFMAEYSSILFMSFLLSFLFFGGWTLPLLVLCSLSFFWIRATLPRLRYDKLMDLAWKSFLPLTLLYLMLSFSYLSLLT